MKRELKVVYAPNLQSIHEFLGINEKRIEGSGVIVLDLDNDVSIVSMGEELKEVSADLLQDLNRFIINEKIIESHQSRQSFTYRVVFLRRGMRKSFKAFGEGA